MKFFNYIFIALLGFNSIAFASGCGFYNFIRTIIKNENVGYPTDKYTVEDQSEDTVTLREKLTGKSYNLKWEKIEVGEVEYSNKYVQLTDVLFEEGHGCGPIYQCVTGKISYIVKNAKTGVVKTYSYPLVIETETYSKLNYILEKPLLPAFGNMKLDVTPSPDIEANPTQCGYSNW